MTRDERSAAAVQEAVKVNRVWGPDDTWEQHNARVVRAAVAAFQKDAPEVEIPEYGDGNVSGSCPCHCDDEHYDACSEDCPWYSDTTGDVECLLNDEVTQGAASRRCPGPGAYVLLEKVQP